MSLRNLALCSCAAAIGGLAIYVGIWQWMAEMPRTALQSEDAVQTSENGPATARGESNGPRVASDNAETPFEPPRQASEGASEQNLVVRVQEIMDRFAREPAGLANYLHESGGSAEALLVVSQITSNLNTLREAARKYPDDALVQLQLGMRGQTADERMQALARAMELEPENAIGGYLTALERLRLGDRQAAVSALAKAMAASGYNDHSLRVQVAREEAFLSIGRPPGEAKAVAAFGLPLQHLQPMEELAKQMSQLHEEYLKSGDAEAAAALRQMGLEMGRRVQGAARYFIDDLVGIAIERRFLQIRDTGQGTSSPPEEAPEQRMALLNQRREEIKALSRAVDTSFVGLPDELAIMYFDRQKLYGEREAIRWLAERQRAVSRSR